MGPLAEPSHSGSQHDVGGNSQLLTAWWPLRFLGLRPQTALAFSLWHCLFASGTKTTAGSPFSGICLGRVSCSVTAQNQRAALEPSRGSGPLLLWWTQSSPGLPLLCCASPQSTSRAVGPTPEAWASTLSPQSLWTEVSA